MSGSIDEAKKLIAKAQNIDSATFSDSMKLHIGQLKKALKAQEDDPSKKNEEWVSAQYEIITLTEANSKILQSLHE